LKRFALVCYLALAFAAVSNGQTPTPSVTPACDTCQMLYDIRTHTAFIAQAAWFIAGFMVLGGLFLTRIKV
jgi:hypothetical protein